jgi:uncharacterized protein YbjT (DUF2867 family)
MLTSPLAKKAGTRVYVLISSANANSGSFFGYPKMKGELEDSIKALNFEHTIIVRPGFIVGQRSATAEVVLRKVKGLMGAVGGNQATDFWAQDAEVIAKAAVGAGLAAVNGEQTEKIRVVGQGDIVRLGRTEWKA